MPIVVAAVAEEIIPAVVLQRAVIRRVAEEIEQPPWCLDRSQLPTPHGTFSTLPGGLRSLFAVEQPDRQCRFHASSHVSFHVPIRALSVRTIKMPTRGFAIVARSNLFYLIIGALVVVVAVLGYQLYQDRHQPQGLNINVGPGGLSIQGK